MDRSIKHFWNLATGAALGLLLACAGQRTSMPFSTPDVELSLDRSSLIMAPGTTGNLTLTVRPQEGFSGVVALSVDATGTAITVSVAPASLTLGTSPAAAVLSIRVPETAAAGDRTLTVHATGTFGQRDLPFRITVPAATLLPIHTHINFSNANLPFMVFKDGDAPWRPLEGNDGSYQAAVTDPAGRYGIAYGYICTIGAFHSYQMNYIFQTLPESASLDVTFICDPPPGPSPTLYSLQGQLGGQGSNSGFLVTSAATLYFEKSASSYLTQVLKGRGDLAGWTFADEATRLPTRFFLERGRDAQSSATRNVNFAAEGFDPGGVQPVTYGAIGGDETIQGAVRYFTASGQYFDLGGGVAPAAYGAFPAERGQAGDSYGYGFEAFAADHSEVVYGGGTVLPGPLSIHFPTPVLPFEVSWPQGSYRRPSLRWSSVLPEPRIQEFSITQRKNQEEIYWFLYFSAGWLGTGIHTVQMPDFTGFAGWNGAWGFQPGTPVSVSLGQFGTLPGTGASVKGKINHRGAEDTEKKQQEKEWEQNKFFYLYPWPLSSGAGSSRVLPTLGRVDGRFQILGLRSPQAGQTGDSFSANRQMTSTP